MANYEMMMILNPEAPDNGIETSIEGVKNALSEAGAKVVSEDLQGSKKLAYKIKSSENGYYALWTLELDGTNIKELNRTFNLDGNIWRYMFVNLDA